MGVRGRRAFLPVAAASPLEQHIRPLSSRLHWQRVFVVLPRATLLGALTLLAFAVLARGFAAPGLIFVGLLLSWIAWCAAVWMVARQRIGPFEVARGVDATLRLRERLATALELLDAGSGGPLAELQIDDATRAAERITPSEAIQFFPAGSKSRRSALQTSGYAAITLLAALVLAFWPGRGSAFSPDDEAGKLAMADPAESDELLTPGQLRAEQELSGNAIVAQTDRPGELGAATEGGRLGSMPELQGQQGQSPEAGQQAQQDAQSQQNPNVAERQQALQDLGNALRQSQTGRQAGESLRRGDADRASQQLSQLADQVSRLSPGERQSLADAFRQAAEQIASKDRALANAAQRAADALRDFRNQDAQQAIRDAANQVSDSGQAAQAQRDLQERANALERGAQPQLPESQRTQGGPQGLQVPQRGQPAAGQGSQPGSQSNQPPRQGGNGGDGSNGLSDMESALRGGGLDGSSGGQQGVGSGAGSAQEGPKSRLGVDARLVQVDAEVREGPSQWRPPSASGGPSGAAAAASAVQAPPASGAPVGAGLDVNTVPFELADPVRQYFTPEQPKP